MKPLNLVLTSWELLLIPIKISECQDLCVTGDKIHFLPSSHFRRSLLAKCNDVSEIFVFHLDQEETSAFLERSLTSSTNDVGVVECERNYNEHKTVICKLGAIQEGPRPR